MQIGELIGLADGDAVQLHLLGSLVTDEAHSTAEEGLRMFRSPPES